MKRLRVIAFSIFALIFVLTARFAFVEYQINTAELVPGDLSDSGATDPGAFGHGTLTAPKGWNGWVLFDVPTEEGQVRKACTRGVPKVEGADVDFVVLDGKWHKLRTGHLSISEAGRTVEPTTTLWRNLIRSDVLFPVARPDGPYRANVLLGKLKEGALSPRDYVRRIVKTVPSCKGAPIP